MNNKEHGVWDKDEEGFYHCNKCNRSLMIGGSLQDVADTSPYCGACLKESEDVNDILDMHERRIESLENEVPAAWESGFNEAYVEVQLVHEQLFKDMQSKNGMTSGRIAAAWFRDQFDKRWKELQEGKRHE